MPTIRRHAPAKINLALHVTGQRADGYHLLDTLVTFAEEIGDELTFENADDIKLTIVGPEASQLEIGPQNLVVKAATLLRETAGVGHLGASIKLNKMLPVASGIGGGSADCAATLLGLCDLWGLDLNENQLAAIGLNLGADVPMCLKSRPLHVSGIGDELMPVSLPSLSLVIVNPRISVSTAEIFSKLPDKTNPKMDPLPISSDATDWISFLRHQRNDLESIAASQKKQIRQCLDVLAGVDAKMMQMSGSGATCFGILSEGTAEDAAFEIKRRFPDWWVVATKTRSG